MDVVKYITRAPRAAGENDRARLASSVHASVTAKKYRPRDDDSPRHGSTVLATCRHHTASSPSPDTSPPTALPSHAPIANDPPRPPVPRPRASGSTACEACPAGSRCPTPSELPVACAEGEYSPEGASTCLTCPAGQYCPAPPADAASKTACQPGTYSLGGATSCSACPRGYYCPDVSQAPVACPGGYFADLGNQTSCQR